MYIQDYCYHIYAEDIILNENAARVSGGAFLMRYTYNVTFKRFKIYNNTAGTVAGAYIWNVDNLIFEDSEIFNNNANFMSAIFMTTTNNITSFKNVKIYNNTSEQDDGAFKLEKSNNYNFINITLQNNTAKINNGGMYINLCSNLTFTDSLINNNYAVLNNGGIQIDSTKNVTFVNTQFLNNSAESTGGLQIYQSFEISFQNTTFLDNFSTFKNGALQIEGSHEINFYNSKFIKNKSKFNGVGQISISDNINIISCIFQQNEAIQGAGLFFSKTSIIEINQSDFIENIVQDSAAALFLSRGTEQIIIQNSNFLKNKSDKFGTAVYINDIIDITFINVKIKENFANIQSSGIQATTVQSINLIDMTFENQFSEEGSCLYLQNVQKLVINNSKFKNNTSIISGGCIYTNYIQYIDIQNSKFENNYIKQSLEDYKFLHQGGAIKIQNTQLLNIKNSQFLNNTLYYQGGAVFLQDIQETIIEYSEFDQNRVYFDKNTDISKKTESYDLTQGGAIYYQFTQYDIQEIENQIISLYIQNNIIQNSQGSSGAGIFLNVNLFVSQQIDIQFKENIFLQNIADIGSSIRILGQFSDFQKEQILNQLQPQTKNDQFSLISEEKVFFGYYNNEKKPSKNSYQYQLCTKGSFLQQGGEFECQRCIQNCECEGGYNKIHPQQKYWRSSQESLDIHYCKKYPELCLGNDKCQEGHKGLLCEDCQITKGYSKNFSGKCEQCSGNETLIFLILGLLFICFILVTQQIYGIYSKIKTYLIQNMIKKLWGLYFNKQQKTSAVSKILLMHIQVLFLTNSISFEYAVGIDSIFSIIGNPSQSLSFKSQCLFEAKNESEEEKVAYQSALAGIYFTLAVAVFLIIIVLIMYLLKQITKYQIPQYMACTLTCFFITIQPGYVQHTFSFLTCRDISNTRYSKADNLIKCDSEHYQYQIYPTMMCLFVFVFFIVPLVFLITLYKNHKKNQLKLVKYLRYLGVLYIDQKPQYYMWEVFTLFFKSLVATTTIVLSEDIIIQGIAISVLVNHNT